LTIKPHSYAQGLLITLRTMQGETIQKIFTESGNETQINMASLRNGIYFLTIYNNKGGTMLSKKIIKTKNHNYE